MKFDKDNKTIIGVRERVLKTKVVKGRKEQEKIQRIREENELKRRLNIAFKVGCLSLEAHITQIIFTGAKPHPSH